MNPNAMLDYLLENPDILEAKGLALVEKTPGSDGSLSLTERQLNALREKNSKLEAQIREMVRAGNENETISGRMHRIALAFFLCETLPTTLALMEETLKKDFQVPAVALRLWATPDRPEDALLPALQAVPNHVRQYADLLDAPYCGREASDPIRAWFNDGKTLQSFAFLPLRTTQTFGLLAMASPDETRFHAGMGTLFLIRLSELTSLALARYLDA